MKKEFENKLNFFKDNSHITSIGDISGDLLNVLKTSESEFKKRLGFHIRILNEQKERGSRDSNKNLEPSTIHAFFDLLENIYNRLN